MGGPSAPSGESQAAANNAQSQWASTYNASMMNPNRVDARGTQTTQQTGWTQSVDPMTGKTTYVPKYTQTNTMSPGEKKIYDANVQGRQGAANLGNTMLSNAAGTLGTPLTEQGPDWAYYNDPGFRNMYGEPYDRAGAEADYMTSYMRSAVPAQQQQEANAAAQGNFKGGKYQFRADQQAADAMGEATRRANDLSFGRSNEAMKLRNEALQGDWANQNLMADQSNATKMSANELARSLRTGTINEIAAMMGLGQPEHLEMPGMQSTPVQPFDIAGANQKKYEADKAKHDAMLSGIFGFGGQLLKGGFGMA